MSDNKSHYWNPTEHKAHPRPRRADAPLTPGPVKHGGLVSDRRQRRPVEQTPKRERIGRQ